MKKIYVYSLVLLFSVTPVKSLLAQINLLNNYQNFNSPPIGTFQGINFREGGFSGLYPIPNTHGKEFWTCSDRGVNVDAANANPAACRPTYDKIFSFPNYAPKIHRIRINGDSIQILQTITIKRPSGANASGVLNPTGLGSTAAELASTDTVLNCANFNLKIAPKDSWALDAEGIVVDKAGNFWICEENGATIWKVNPNGVVIRRYTPYANLPGAQLQDLMIDEVFKFRKNNRGFEGIAIAPNGKIYAMIQSPIFYPTQSVGENTQVHRLLEIDPVTDTWRMFAYLNDGIMGAPGANQIRLRDWKLGDLAAISDTTFLVLEAALRGTTDIKRLYKINISNATPVTSGLYGGLTLEALTNAAGLTANNITPVQKTLVMDLLANGWPSSLEKAEGIAIINSNTIALVNDNDYGQVSPNQDGIATATGITSHLFTYGLNGSSALNNFNFIGIDLSQGRTAQSSSQPPYLTPYIPGVHFTSILTTGDAVNSYKMSGIPDGLGAFDNNDGTFTVLMNHELGNTSGVVRAHGSKGAFVSKWVINKSDLSVVSGADLMRNLKLWNPATLSYTTYNIGNPYTTGLSRFCSADLPWPSAFYNSKTGRGTSNRIFMDGEESGAEGRQFGHIVTGPEAGTSYELPRLGKSSWENSVTNPATGDLTVVGEMDDATPGQVFFYIGTKTTTGNDIDKAGLSNGNLYGPVINGFSIETDAIYPAPGTPFTLANLGNVQNMTGAQVEAASNAAGIARFLRPEDGSWDPYSPNDFYFVTTNGFSNPSRLWKLHFNDLANPQAGGTVTVLLNGTEGHKMLDNMTIDNSGHILLQEDVGNNAHIGKIWQYTIGNGEFKIIAQHDSTRFKSGGANFLTQDEESSGIIDAQAVLGPGMFLSVVQAHYPLPGELVEGGQLLAFFNPDTYSANPEIDLTGNGISIVSGDITPDPSDNTQYGNVNPGNNLVHSFVIENRGNGPLRISGLGLDGSNAALFTLVNPPALPFTIAPNASQTIQVKFAPVASGVFNASLEISSNDFSEAFYVVALQGSGVCTNYPTSITVSPNPTVSGQLLNTIYLGYGPQSVTLTVGPQGSFAPYSYSWSPVASSSSQVLVSPVSSTTYTVNVLNAYSCPSTASQLINVIDIRDGNKDKIFICHGGHTQSVSVNAVPAHLAHGDQLGNCERGSLMVSNKSLLTGQPAKNIIYPNPAGNKATLRLDLSTGSQVSISITDAVGRIVMPAIKKQGTPGVQPIDLNLEKLSNGIYWVRVSTKEGTGNYHLIVLHQ